VPGTEPGTHPGTVPGTVPGSWAGVTESCAVRDVDGRGGGR